MKNTEKLTWTQNGLGGSGGLGRICLMTVCMLSVQGCAQMILQDQERRNLRNPPGQFELKESVTTGDRLVVKEYRRGDPTGREFRIAK